MDLAKKASLMVIMVDNNDFTYFDAIKELERARMALKKKANSIEEQIEQESPGQGDSPYAYESDENPLDRDEEISEIEEYEVLKQKKKRR
jgi:hypothetical protein